MTAKEYIKSQSSKIKNQTELVDALAKLNSYQDKTAKGVDPATVAAIAGAILKLIDLFSGGNDDDLVQQIKDDIDYIVSLLEEVVEILREIEVIIKEEFTSFVKNSLQANLDVISDSHEVWKVGLSSSDSDLRNQTFNEITNVYTNMQQSARLATFYGYAHYDSIALAFVAEGHLCKLLNKPKEYIKNTLIPRYQSYFIRAISDIPDSLLSRQYTIVNLGNQLVARFQPATILISKTTERRGRTEYYYDNFLKIEGDVVNGFTFSESRQNTGESTDPIEPGGNPSRGDKGDSLLKNITFQNANRIKQSYNDSHLYYIDTIIPSIKTLVSAVHSCNNYTQALENIKTSLL